MKATGAWWSGLDLSTGRGTSSQAWITVGAAVGVARWVITRTTTARIRGRQAGGLVVVGHSDRRLGPAH
ncbi:MAG: hypothetical protein NTW51_06560 [Cyanobacteria bacterium]|nr:hypothetical protein [Cyanobacteriota bacterium]